MNARADSIDSLLAEFDKSMLHSRRVFDGCVDVMDCDGLTSSWSKVVTDEQWRVTLSKVVTRKMRKN